MMHKVLHNFGDWELDTRYMTRIEKSIYFDMRTLYLKDGKPLTDDLPLLERLLSCHSDDEKQALAFVISHKFTHDKKRHAYRHKEWDLILKNYKFRHKGTDNDGTHDGTDYGTHDGTDYGTHDRKKAFRERQKALIDLLKAHGIQANSRMGYKELLALCKQHGIDVMQDNDGTHDGTNTQTTDNDGQKNGTKNQAITINHKPITINQELNNISPQTPQGACVGASENETAETSNEANHANAQTKQTPTAKPKTKYADEIATIFEFWICTFGKDKNKTKLSDTRRRKITQRLEQGYTVDDIKTAIVNCSKSDYHMAGGHTDIELICRDEVHIDRFLAMKPKTTAQPTKFYGTPADPLAVNQKHFPTPPNWKENLEKAMAMGSNPIGLTEI